MTALQLFSGLALKLPLEGVVLPRFFDEHREVVESRFEPTTVLVEMLHSGARTDILIAVENAVADLGTRRLVDGASSQTLVRAGLGLAVPAGSEPPPIDSVAAFVEVLVAARSVAYSRTGASGIYFARLIEQLGIAERVNPTATVVPKGLTGECLLDERADVAVQQISELRAVSGIQVVGAFPAEVQHYTTFAVAYGSMPAGRGPKSSVRKLRAALDGPEAHAAYIEAGLEPARPGAGAAP